MQTAIVALVVAAAVAYAIWTLVPPVRRLFGRDKGVGCGGCDSCGPAPRMEHGPGTAGGTGPREQPIRIVRR